MTWQTQTLGEICDEGGGEVRTGPFGSQLHESDYSEVGTPVVMPKDIIEGRVSERTVARIADEHVHRLAQHQLRTGDIVYGRRGDIGRQALITSRESGWLCGTGCLRITPGRAKVDSTYLHYYLRDASVIEGIAQQAIGATMPNLNTAILRGIQVRFPPASEQRRIASILSAYDDLIENNRRRMALLEESARLLYREWFVHLRFPGHEHVPITDGVPEGWERKKIGDVSVFLSRGITPKYDDDAMGLVINQKCIRNNRVSLDQARRQSKEVPPAKLVRRGDVLVNSTGEGTLGRVAQLWVEIENCTVDSHVTIVRPADGIPVSLFGATLCALEDRISQMGRGATNQTELSRESLAELPILLPPRGLVEGFEEFASDASTQVSKLSNQIDQLKSARDLLLPRLMNGEITV